MKSSLSQVESQLPVCYLEGLGPPGLALVLLSLLWLKINNKKFLSSSSPNPSPVEWMVNERWKSECGWGCIAPCVSWVVLVGKLEIVNSEYYSYFCWDPKMHLFKYLSYHRQGLQLCTSTILHRGTHTDRILNTFLLKIPLTSTGMVCALNIFVE